MEEQANNEAGRKGQEPRMNAGRFQRGDQRINRDGRPKKSWAACADPAPSTDRLKLLVVPARGLLHRISRQLGPYLTNCPPDCKIIDIRFDADRNAAVFIIRSEGFPLIPKGAPLAEFRQDIFGVEWKR